MRLVKIGLASVNATVGSVDSNTARVIQLLAEMERDGVTVACFPEQVLGGYPAEDLVQWRGFVAAQWRALAEVARAGEHSGVVAVLGVSVAHRGHLFNCAAVLHRGRVLGLVPK